MLCWSASAWFVASAIAIIVGIVIANLGINFCTRHWNKPLPQVSPPTPLAPRLRPLSLCAEHDNGKTSEEKEERRVIVRDVLYQYIELNGLARRFIDTVEFQGLRDLKQLGSAWYVFPSATHTRFEHSLGVYHLVGKLLRHIRRRQPHLFPKDPVPRRRFIELVQLAGLLHDIGHCATSHCFDERVSKALNLPHHEERGVKLIREMVQRYSIPLLQGEVDFVCGLILGETDISPSWVSTIVCSDEDQFDFDKIDYIARDSYHLGLGNPIQVERLIKHARVLPLPTGKTLRICYDRKVFLQVCDVFQSRYRLFREVYRHRAVIGVDEMIGEIMRLLIPLFRLLMSNGLRPVDDILGALPHILMFVPDTLVPKQDKEMAKQLWHRIRSRQHYRAEHVEHEKDADVHVRLGLSSLEDDPVEKVWFYNGRSAKMEAQRIKIHNITKLLGSSPRTASETLHYKLVK